MTDPISPGREQLPACGEPGRTAGHLPTAAQEKFLRILFGQVVLTPRQPFNPETAGQEICSLLPLLARRRAHDLSEPIREMALEIENFLALRNRILLARLAEVLELLGQAGIPTLILKGAAMISAWYRDPGLRFMEDADFMVRQEDVPRALEILGKHGLHWKIPRRLTPAFFAARHHIDMTTANGSKLELHWHLLVLVWHPGTDEPFWNHSRPLPATPTPLSPLRSLLSASSLRTRILCPEHQLFHTCVHAAQYYPEPHLRWIADSILLLEQTPAFDWDLLVETALPRQLTLALRVALGYLKRLREDLIPAPVLDRLARAPVSTFEREDLAELTTPRNSKTGWQRGRTLWRRYCAWTSKPAGWRRWAGFPVFLRHYMHKPGYADFLLQLVKGRFQ